MSTTTAPRASSPVWNIPNALSALRIVMAVVVFVLIPFQRHWAALIVFLAAVFTDWLDGHLARAWRQTSRLGRILDPFADKFIICGVLIIVATLPEVGPGMLPVALIVVSRELLVSTIRALAEKEGHDFSARWSGKVKMVLQCIGVAAALLLLAAGGSTAPPWLAWTARAAVWLMAAFTAISGLDYLIAAAPLLRERE